MTDAQIEAAARAIRAVLRGKRIAKGSDALAKAALTAAAEIVPPASPIDAQIEASKLISQIEQMLMQKDYKSAELVLSRALTAAAEQGFAPERQTQAVCKHTGPAAVGENKISPRGGGSGDVEFPFRVGPNVPNESFGTIIARDLKTAAAEVGEWKSTAKNNAMQVLAERNAELAQRLNAIIERCAQRAHDWMEHHGYEAEAIECARAIFVLKEIDDDKCISEHLYQHTGQGGSEGKEMRCEKCGKTKQVPW